MIGEDLLQECPPLTALTAGDGATIEMKFIEIGKVYKDCRDGKHLLINAARPPEAAAP